MKKQTKAKIIAGALIATTFITALTGCSNKKQKYTDSDSYYSSIASNTDSNEAAVVICNNDVLVFLSDYHVHGNTYSGFVAYKYDRFYSNYFVLEYTNKEELEAKIKVLAGDDAQIHYQEEYAKVKSK